MGSEEDLSLAPDQAWEDVVKCDTGEEEEETGHARSVSELSGCLPIKCTMYITPSAQCDNQEHEAVEDKDMHDIMWSGHRNILTAQDDETILSRRGTVRGSRTG